MLPGRDWLLVGAAACLLVLAPGVAAANDPVTGPSMDSPSSPAPEATETAPPPLSVRAETAAGTLRSTGATWQTRTPRLVGPLDLAVLASIDAALAAKVDGELAAFEARSESPTDTFLGVDQLDADFTVALLTPELLSLRLLTSTYASGAAHGGTAMEPWSFDLLTGERLSLDDLFTAGADYLPALARAARSRLLPVYGTDRTARSWVRDGTRPIPANYAGWALTEEGLELTFAQYQVASYADGMPVVLIPWPELGNLLDPAGPAASLYPGTAPAGGSPTPAATLEAGLRP